MRGCSRRSWSRTKRVSDTAAAASRARRTGRPIVPDPEPWRTAKSSAVTPMPRLAAPATSRGSGNLARDSIIFVETSTKARIPSGMLIVKMERQPSDIVIHAPISGPIRLATPQTPEKSPWIFARSLSE